jgi:superfamily II DNA or RNA helicase|nr:MAG TPA: Recombination ATPase helicase [Caudoviricetes sp.]
MIEQSLELTPEQLEKVEAIVAQRDGFRAALDVSDTGTGKTLCAVEVAKRLEPATTLIVGPAKPQIVSAWKATFARQGVELPFKRIDSKHLGHFDDIRAGVPGVYYVGREYLGLSDYNAKNIEKGKENLLPWSKAKPDFVVYDEVQSASNRKSGRAKAMWSLRNAGFKLAMSATPQGNRFEGLWSICRWLWWNVEDPSRVPLSHDKRDWLFVEGSFHRWKARWCIVQNSWIHDRYGRLQEIETIVAEKEPGAFLRSLPCVVGLPAERKPVDTRIVECELTHKQRDIYDKLQYELISEVEGGLLVASLPIVKLVRLRQVALGEPCMVYDPDIDMDRVTFDSDCRSRKLDMLNALIEKYHAHDKVLVFTSSQRFANAVAHRVCAKTALYTGAQSAKARSEAFAGFTAGGVQVLLCTVGAAAEGLDGLQRVCHVEVWLDEDLNGMLCEQAKGRLNRMGQPADRIIRYYFQARDTMDDGTFQRLAQQAENNRSVLNK